MDSSDKASVTRIPRGPFEVGRNAHKNVSEVLAELTTRSGNQEQRGVDKTNTLHGTNPCRDREEGYNFGVDVSHAEIMLEEHNMSALKSSHTLRWDRCETDEQEPPANEQTSVSTAGWKIAVDRQSGSALCDGKSLIKPGTCERYAHENVKSVLRYLRGNPGIVEEFFLSGGPSSSAEVRMVVVHDIKEVEGERQQDVQEDKGGEEIGSEVEGDVEETHSTCA